MNTVGAIQGCLKDERNQRRKAGDTTAACGKVVCSNAVPGTSLIYD